MYRHIVRYSLAGAILTIASLASVATNAFAQAPASLNTGTVRPQRASAVDPFGIAELTTERPANAAAKPADQAKESARLQRLKTLTYDRRLSTILRAWSEPESEQDSEDQPESASTEVSEPSEFPTGDFINPIEIGGVVTTIVTSSTPQAVPAASAMTTKAAEESGDSTSETATATATTEGASDTNAQAKPEEKPAKPEIDPKVLEAELKAIQRNVTLGNWDAVKAYFAGLPEKEGEQGYARMVQSLGAPEPQPGVDPRAARMSLPGVGQIGESNLFTLEDMLGILGACPHPRKRETIQSLVPILNAAMQRGIMDESLLELLKQQLEAPEGEATLTRAESAWLLQFSGRTKELEPFLPSYEEALEKKDAESLILLAKCYLARYEHDKKPETLEKCWAILQPACTMGEAKAKQRKTALGLTLSLVPRVREELGMAWLDKMFSGDPELGMRILASTGTSASTAIQTNPSQPAMRLQNLKVQQKIVESLLDKAPDRAAEWDTMLRMLAGSWLTEAEISRVYDQSSSMGPRLRRDPYGNYFYFNMNEDPGNQFRQRQGNQPQPITSGEMLEVAPSERWLSRLDDAMRPKFNALHAQLYLKVGEEERAFPFIERVAKGYPDLARDLVHEFIRMWTQNHNPNASQSYTNSYMYMYGYDTKASGIPLTRSKQERNIEELTAWVRRIRQLDIEDLDESLLAGAFTNCHSSAEVYRLEDIEDVFGSIEELKPATLAKLLQQMRGNLVGVWRAPATQQAAKTQRKQQDIQAEVLRGYAVTRAVVADGLKRHPGSWQIQLAHACLLLDEVMFENEVATSSEFSEKRLAALEEFRKAADSYAADVSTMTEEEQVSTVYEHWFYAGLGASDLNRIDHSTTADPRQPALIREAILSLPGEAAESHLGKFANSLFTRMSALNPAAKFDYLKSGFEIVGDHKQALEARKVYDYYNDLVTEIKLVARLDGSGLVGHDAPFGVFVEIHHTREIERESGGFAKYLQNQQNAMYSYNYGRPLENYRDKFEEGVRAALQENFDVLSVTFYDEKDIRSLATEKYGWRNTPYAYVLLKSHGPEIDKVPALKIDLDFLDTSGYVALPVTSPPIPIDAAPDRIEQRPYEKVSLTQILDEREAASGRLKLEIKATGRGLIPPLEQLADVRSSDFEVANTEDQGVLVSRFDTEAGQPSIISERTWIVDYEGRKDLAALPVTFQFPEPNGTPKEVSYLRYEDADLKAVEPTVMLQHEYGEVRAVWPWVLAIAGFLLAATLVGIFAWRRTRSTEDETQLAMPETLTPFNVLAFLRGIERANGFNPEVRRELKTNIKSIERYYFAGATDGNGHEPNLQSVTEKWLSRTQ